MILIDKSVLTMDFKSGAAMYSSRYSINDSFTNQLPKANTYKFNGTYNVSFMDPTFIFNSRFNSNFERVPKRYLFNSVYGSGPTTLSVYQFYGRYKFANIESGVSTYGFSASYQMAPSTDGVINFNSPYKYIINESLFEFSCKYASENYISTASDNYVSIGVNVDDGVIALESHCLLHRMGLLNYDDVVMSIKNNIIQGAESSFENGWVCIDLSMRDIGKHLRASNKTLAIIINNGSMFQNVVIPLLIDADGEFYIEGIYNSYVKFYANSASITSSEFSTSELFADNVVVPFIYTTIRNIDPNRPVSFKYATLDIVYQDLVRD